MIFYLRYEVAELFQKIGIKQYTNTELKKNLRLLFLKACRSANLCFGVVVWNKVKET